MSFEGEQPSRETLLNHEWLVTNALGGYASGTVSGALTRRYHGLLIAALPGPHGRMVMWSHVSEHLRFGENDTVSLGSEERAGGQLDLHGGDYLSEFRLEAGLPVWTYKVRDLVLEKRILLPHLQNTVHLSYRVLAGDKLPRLELRPAVHFRKYDAAVSEGLVAPCELNAIGKRYEIAAAKTDLPPLRLCLYAREPAFKIAPSTIRQVIYRSEQRRGYDYEGNLWSPGFFRMDLEKDGSATLIGSTENWDTIEVLTPAQAEAAERERRAALLRAAAPAAQSGVAAELVYAADQFIISPAGRFEEAARAHAAGDEVRTVIAGYHWFTDWGRDTMISLEGLTLVTGRSLEAGYILRTFAQYVRDGLIPNMFPDGKKEGLYNTADATLWYFHALHRYLLRTRDQATLKLLLPMLVDIIEHHLRGTRFNIHVDPDDGLLCQGEEGCQLTWMDAKVGDWVVTPRRGKAVEINALWFNALMLLTNWLRMEGNHDSEKKYAEAAERARTAFNERFWNAESGYLYDVVEGDDGNDPACRPNQIFAIALDHPVLDRERWASVLEGVRKNLLTPVGLRSLAPGDSDYKPTYHGDRRTRDAAYHQGTVWPWLIGPFIDAWSKLHPDKKTEARSFLKAFAKELGEAGLGTISEVFDAEVPHIARGCIAQAWSVAEVLRCWVETAGT